MPYSEVSSFELQLVDDSHASVDQGDGVTLTQHRIDLAPIAAGCFLLGHFELDSASLV